MIVRHYRCMSPVDKFHAYLRQLDEQFVASVALSRRDTPPPDEELAATRWAVVRTLAEIGAFHEKFIFAPIDASGDPDLIARGTWVREEIEAGMKRMVDHAHRWPAAAVRDDRQGFRDALCLVDRKLRNHMAWQANVLPPLLDVLCGASAVPKRNWTRGIWAVQEAVQGR